MYTISNHNDLLQEIKLLEMEQANDFDLLKNQFNIVQQNFSILSLLTQPGHPQTTPKSFISSLLTTFTGSILGSLTKKVIVGQSHSIYKTVVGNVLQYSVATFVTKHPQTVNSIFHYLFDKLSVKSNK